MSVKKNVIANYFGQAVQGLMAVAFVPLYIKYLGIEAYGLMGIFAMLQAWLVLLDMGIRPALGREMARFTAGAHTPQSIRNLLRSVEFIGIGVAVTFALGVWASSGWLAAHWVTVKHLPVEVVTQSFAIMGVVTALRFIEEIYSTSIIGLQRQVLYSSVMSIMATARGLGAVCVLVWISPTLKAFFIWQSLVSVASVSTFAIAGYRALPVAPERAHFSLPALAGVWRFAAGMTGITLLSLMLTQVDKILLSRLLTLEAFGYYSLAGGVINGLYMLILPISAACYPRFTQLIAGGDMDALRALYHQAAQTVTVLMGSAAIVLMLFAGTVVRLWTGDPVIAGKVAPLLTLLALGALLNGLKEIPYQLQIASGWTSLTIRANIVAVCLFAPGLLWIVPAYGAMGAARVWALLNAAYVLIVIPIMHTRLLTPDKWRWYGQDVALPLAAATTAAFLCRWLKPQDVGSYGEFSVLIASSTCTLICAALAAPLVRDPIIRYLSNRIRSLNLRTA